MNGTTGGAREARPRSGFALRRATPAAVTLVALAVAFDRFDLGGVARTAADLPVWTLPLIVLALLAGNLLASLRLALVARDLHQPLRLRDAVVAMSAGQLAGSFFFQIIGQTIARSAVLAKSGISVSATIVITVYERIIAAVVSFAIALLGTFYLFGRMTLDIAGGGDQLLKIAAGLTIVAATGAGFVWGGRAWLALKEVMSRRNLLQYGRASAISTAIQATTMAAYMAAAHGLSPAIPLVALMAATALVMLAASFPISLAGWGLRELSAIYALGAIGMPYGASLLVALLIGSTSIAVTAGIALLGPWLGSSAASRSRSGSAAAAPDSAGPDYARLLCWLIPLFAASAVFFQLYLPVGGGVLDVNLADSVVLFGGFLFILRLASGKTGRAESRLPGLGVFVALMSAVVVLAFLHGVLAFGWTSWAFTNRLFGWLVLLAYAATGALIVLQEGPRGLDILLRTFIASGLAVAALGLALFVAASFGAPLPAAFLDYRLQGFAQNPNAFAFQLLLVLAAIIALGSEGRSPRLLMALAFAAMFYTASRAGEGTCLALCIAALMLRFLGLRQLLLSLGIAAVVIVATTSHSIVTSQYAHGISDTERWTSVVAGFDMFLGHPIFGAGLGAFIDSYAHEHGHPLIIHSTPVWLLAETGMVGLAVFAAPFLYLFRRELRLAQRSDVAGRLLLLSLIAFGVMSQAHELLYQRTLWVLLGAALVNSLPGGRAAEGAVTSP